MKYVSIDLETTGLNPERCQILSVGMVIEDTDEVLPIEELPRLEIRIIWDHISGGIFAINLNKVLIYKILNETVEEDVIYCKIDELEHRMYDFLRANIPDTQRYNVAGKNFNGFDIRFLNKVLKYDYFRFGRRVIDPAILHVDWLNDKSLPSLGEIKERAGIEGVVTHNAVDDAIDVIEAMRIGTTNYSR
jgi:oligoribonuclease